MSRGTRGDFVMFRLTCGGIVELSNYTYLNMEYLLIYYLPPYALTCVR